MNQDANIEKIEKGRAATLAESVINELVEDHINVCITQLIQMYRSEVINHDVLIGKVAEIAAMHGLMNELETRQRIGHIAAEKEMKYGS